MANELAGTCMLPKSPTALVTGDTAVGSAGVLASKRLGDVSTVMADDTLKDVDTHPLLPFTVTESDTGIALGLTNRTVTSVPSSLT